MPLSFVDLPAPQHPPYRPFAFWSSHLSYHMSDSSPPVRRPSTTQTLWTPIDRSARLQNIPSLLHKMRPLCSSLSLPEPAVRLSCGRKHTRWPCKQIPFCPTPSAVLQTRPAVSYLGMNGAQAPHAASMDAVVNRQQWWQGSAGSHAGLSATSVRAVCVLQAASPSAAHCQQTGCSRATLRVRCLIMRFHLWEMKATPSSTTR